MTRLSLLLLLLSACDSGALHVGGGTCASANDASGCAAIDGCVAVGCPTCDGGTGFSACIVKGQPYGLLCPHSECELQACESLNTSGDCDARSDCYSLYSGDKPCNNASCSNHFTQCLAGPAQCAAGTGPCTADCTEPATCRAGFVPAYTSASQSCCPSGCVAETLCPRATSCTSDAACGPDAYCKGFLDVCLTDCQLTIGTPKTGSCHRSCLSGNCDCVDDADCPGPYSSCIQGACRTLQPPICNAPGCPAGCRVSSAAQYGTLCTCDFCE